MSLSSSSTQLCDGQQSPSLKNSVHINPGISGDGGHGIGSHRILLLAHWQKEWHLFVTGTDDPVLYVAPSW